MQQLSDSPMKPKTAGLPDFIQASTHNSQLSKLLKTSYPLSDAFRIPKTTMLFNREGWKANA
jgi:hypothetical protein